MTALTMDKARTLNNVYGPEELETTDQLDLFGRNTHPTGEAVVDSKSDSHKTASAGSPVDLIEEHHG